jgi:hypothetical protein
MRALQGRCIRPLTSVALVSGVVLSACGDDEPDRTAASSTTPTAATDALATTTTSAVGASSSTSTSAPSSVGTTVGEVDVASLRDNGDGYVGSVVTVVGRAFFVETCPPPSTIQAGRCVISLYLVEPERSDLTYGERDEGVPVWEHGVGVSCEVGDGVTVACPGWEQASVYELTGRVVAQPGGGKVVLDLAG